LLHLGKKRCCFQRGLTLASNVDWVRLRHFLEARYPELRESKKQVGEVVAVGE